MIHLLIEVNLQVPDQMELLEIFLMPDYFTVGFGVNS
jgi:hypothetical protein